MFDLDLLDGLDDLLEPIKEVEKPKGTFVFGRTKTPDLNTPKSVSRLNTKGEEWDIAMTPIDRSLASKNPQQLKFDGVLKEASKKMAKESKEVDYLSKNKEIVAVASKRALSKSIDRPVAKAKASVNVPPKAVENKSSKAEANKENAPPTRKEIPKVAIERKPSVAQLSKNSVQTEDAKKSNLRDVTNQTQQVQKKKSSVSPVSKKNVELESYASRADLKVKPEPAAVEIKIPKSPITTKDKPESKQGANQGKSPNPNKRDTSKKPYKPETMDLYMRLNEYTKFKENVDKLAQPDVPAPAPVKPVPTPTQSKEKTEEFLMKQINQFKEKNSPGKGRSRTPQKSIDLQKVSQPRLKKKPVELANECSFQPMLSKRSMEIIRKNVSRLLLGI